MRRADEDVKLARALGAELVRDFLDLVDEVNLQAGALRQHLRGERR